MTRYPPPQIQPDHVSPPLSRQASAQPVEKAPSASSRGGKNKSPVKDQKSTKGAAGKKRKPAPSIGGGNKRARN